ncbi:hypothetical protein KAT95_03340 [Candidatus Parcubacteria bacterium]|nr:hypothetical protein [Candidatus Parcubacteria bacterium]
MRKFLFMLSVGLVLFAPVVIQGIEIENPLDCATIDCVIASIAGFIFMLAIAIAPIMFIIAGFAFITAAGDPVKIQKAKDIVLWTVIGLAIVLMAYGIINVIQEIFIE